MFPFAPVHDTFDRADSTITTANSIYDNVTGGPRVVSNQLAPAASPIPFTLHWGVSSFSGADVYITALNGTAYWTSSNDQSLMLLWDYTTKSGYVGNWGLGATKIFRVDNNVWTALTTTFTTLPWNQTPGQLGFRITPQERLEQYYNGILIKQVASGGVYDVGYIGVGFNVTVATYRWEDLGGGDYSDMTMPGSLKQRSGTISDFDSAYVHSRAWF